jgi:hypothetical protein
MNPPPGSIEAAISRAYYNPQQKQFLLGELRYLMPFYRFTLATLPLRNF